MKKRHLISAVAILLALMLLGLSCGALAEGKTFGVLSFLNVTEEEDHELGAIRQSMREILLLDGVLEQNDTNVPSGRPVYRYYDTLNTMLMGLQAGEVNAINLPYYTAKYLCSANDNLMATMEYHPEKATEITDWALGWISDGYSFMLKEENAALRDAFDAQITAMKEDGTLEQLRQRYVEDVITGGDPDAVEPEIFPGAPTIRVAVTGDRPPMDYVSAGGEPLGFNTALIAEIAKGLGINVEFVNVNCAARGIALATGVCDIVFWMEVGDFENWEGADFEDQPENTLVTDPYLSVSLWWAVRADSPVVNVYRDQ